jgi:hypothetical protein
MGYEREITGEMPRVLFSAPRWLVLYQFFSDVRKSGVMHYFLRLS